MGKVLPLGICPVGAKVAALPDNPSEALEPMEGGVFDDGLIHDFMLLCHRRVGRAGQRRCARYLLSWLWSSPDACCTLCQVLSARSDLSFAPGRVVRQSAGYGDIATVVLLTFDGEAIVVELWVVST